MTEELRIMVKGNGFGHSMQTHYSFKEQIDYLSIIGLSIGYEMRHLRILVNYNKKQNLYLAGFKEDLV